MSRALDKQAVRQWLSGQRAAAERIEVERAASLASLPPKRSLQIYLELWSLCGGKCSKTPSPLLLAMRLYHAWRAGKHEPPCERQRRSPGSWRTKGSPISPSVAWRFDGV